MGFQVPPDYAYGSSGNPASRETYDHRILMRLGNVSPLSLRTRLLLINNIPTDAAASDSPKVGEPTHFLWRAHFDVRKTTPDIAEAHPRSCSILKSSNDASMYDNRLPGVDNVPDTQTASNPHSDFRNASTAKSVTWTGTQSQNVGLISVPGRQMSSVERVPMHFRHEIQQPDDTGQGCAISGQRVTADRKQKKVFTVTSRSKAPMAGQRVDCARCPKYKSRLGLPQQSVLEFSDLVLS